MKTKLLLSLLLSLNFYLLSSQVPQGFNYQAIARDPSTGDAIANATIDVKLGILSDTLTPVIVREELFSSVKTDRFGVFILVIGTGTYQTGSVINFSDIDWTAKQLYLKIQVKLHTDVNWKYMGSAKLWSVPYSMVAGNLEGTVPLLSVKGNTTTLDSALFVVRNNTGQIVFAVYNEGVRIYVDDGVAKGATKGGFAIGSFDKSKGTSQTLFVVDPDSIRAYIDTGLVKSRKGGFAIGGFDKSKAGSQQFFQVTQDSIRVYINDLPSKSVKGGFAIGGFSNAKGAGSNYFNVATDTLGIVNPAQNRILWYPLKNALLAGNIIINNPDSVGTNSFSSGYESKAVGLYSQALGYQSIAIGNYSSAIGYKNIASGMGSTAMGYASRVGDFGDMSMAVGWQCYVDAPTSLAVGANAYAAGMASYAFGYDATATGDYATAMGANALASGSGSTAFGEHTTASGPGSTATGLATIASGKGSFSAGWYSTAQSYASAVFGQYNVVSGNSTSWVATDPLFILGNGTSSSSPSNAITVLKNGNVGIGTTAPAEIIQIGLESSGSTARNAIKIGSGGYSAPAAYQTNSNGDKLILYNADSYDGRIGIGSGAAMWFKSSGSTANNGSFIWYNGPASTECMRVDGTGNVGIGTTTPGYKLQVGNAADGSQARANAWNLLSDIRFKTGFEYLNDALDKISALRGFYFYWNTGTDKNRQFGLSAQDVEKVLPEVVSKGTDGYLSVDYGKLVPLLIEGIKDQQQQIESYKSEIHSLQEKVDHLNSLENEVSDLKTLLNSLVANQTWQGNK